jgi:hypothetical protein
MPDSTDRWSREGCLLFKTRCERHSTYKDTGPKFPSSWALARHPSLRVPLNVAARVPLRVVLGPHRTKPHRLFPWMHVKEKSDRGFSVWARLGRVAHRGPPPNSSPSRVWASLTPEAASNQKEDERSSNPGTLGPSNVPSAFGQWC